jgi:hypothetical protein
MRVSRVRAAVAAIAAAVPLLAGAAGCRRGHDAEARRRTATLGEALRPGFFVAALRRLGGAHFHGTARFAVESAAPADTVTTTTDVWLDRKGNYRVRESNDRDGGREVVLYGRELAVALRYGKMIRRAAEEPEPTRLLEEALGAPGAAWEVVAGAAVVERAAVQLSGGAKATPYLIGLAPGAAAARARGALDSDGRGFTGMRAWRRTLSVSALDGRVLVDDATGAVMQVDFKAAFTMKQEGPGGRDRDGDGGRILRGELEVHTALSEVASAPPIERPPAEDLALRQRTVPEQRELVGGLPGAPAAEPTARARSRERERQREREHEHEHEHEHEKEKPP